MTPDQEKKANKPTKTKKESIVKDMSDIPQRPSPAQQTPASFTISVEGVNEIAQCLNEVNLNKHLKQGLFNALNEHLKPVFD